MFGRPNANNHQQGGGGDAEHPGYNNFNNRPQSRDPSGQSFARSEGMQPPYGQLRPEAPQAYQGAQSGALQPQYGQRRPEAPQAYQGAQSMYPHYDRRQPEAPQAYQGAPFRGYAPPPGQHQMMPRQQQEQAQARQSNLSSVLQALSQTGMSAQVDLGDGLRIDLNTNQQQRPQQPMHTGYPAPVYGSQRPAPQAPYGPQHPYRQQPQYHERYDERSYGPQPGAYPYQATSAQYPYAGSQSRPPPPERLALEGRPQPPPTSSMRPPPPHMRPNMGQPPYRASGHQQSPYPEPRQMTPQVSQSPAQPQDSVRNIAPSARLAHLPQSSNMRSQQSPLFSSGGVPSSDTNQVRASTDAPIVASDMPSGRTRVPTTSAEWELYREYGELWEFAGQRFVLPEPVEEPSRQAHLGQSPKTGKEKRGRQSHADRTDSQAPKAKSKSAIPGLHGVKGSKVSKSNPISNPKPQMKAPKEGQQNRQKPLSGSDDDADGGSTPSQPRPPPQAQGNVQQPPRFAGNPWRTVMVPASRPERRPSPSDDQINGQDSESAGTRNPRDPPDPSRSPCSEAQQASDRGPPRRQPPPTSPQEGRLAGTSDSRDPRHYRRPPLPASRCPPPRSAHPDAEHGD